MGEAAGASLSSLKNNDFPIVDDAPGWSDRRLRDLPTETVAKIRAVQPFAQAAPQLTHPLTYLRSLSNADKHHRGLRVGLIPAPPLGQSLLTTLQLTIPVEDLEVSESLRIEPQDLRLEPGPFFDGDIVFSVNLPQGRDWRAMEADNLNLPLELALFSAVDPEPGLTPVLPSIGNAVRFVSGCIRFITGVVDSPPRPFTSDHLSGPSESA